MKIIIVKYNTKPGPGNLSLNKLPSHKLTIKQQ